MRYALIGLLALALAGGAVTTTGLFLTGGIRKSTVPVYAEFSTCGQVLHEGGDVKLRGVLVGRIGELINTPDNPCRIRLNIIPDDIDQIPANAGAQIRAKTFFGEKWVELLIPTDPTTDRIASGDTIPTARTIDPIEVETILQVALPLLDAIDPERLAGALDALADGFEGSEDDVIAAIEDGIEALGPLNRNRGLLKEGLGQLEDAGEVLADVDDELLLALASLDDLNDFTIANEALLAENLAKTPALLSELSRLFRVRLVDFTKLAVEGATVIGLLSARVGDVERLLVALPKFNSAWIRNLDAGCPVRMITTEPGLSKGDLVPGRCWRVHNILSESRGPYEEGEEPRPELITTNDYLLAGLANATSPLGRVLYAPALRPRGER